MSPRVEVVFPQDTTIHYDRALVRFVLKDCFKMAFAIGSGLALGLIFAVGAVAAASRLMFAIAELFT